MRAKYLDIKDKRFLVGVATCAMHTPVRKDVLSSGTTLFAFMCARLLKRETSWKKVTWHTAATIIRKEFL